MAGSSRLCRHLHVPLQSGDDRILAAMGRRYSVAEYRAFVEHAAAKIPDLGLGSDLIAGFPGEDEEAFRNTVETARDLPFSYLHVFPYSPRPGTRAAAMENRVPQKEKRRRTALLIGIGEEKQRRFVARFVGKPVSVLVEQISGPDSGTGWTREYVEARVRRAGLQPNRIVEFVPSRVEGTCLTT
jgi:threonylcarbamoyladenosine tRNA methylthiotransferase MtaB